VDFLSPAEEERLAGMRFERRRSSFQMGRLAAKQILRLHTACAALPPTAVTVANHPAGGPYIVVDGQALSGCLSVSHREDAAVCALVVNPGVAVGIDLEMVEERTAAFVDDFFTKEEACHVISLPEVERAAWVTRVWSAKEAVLKALGVGLHVDSRTVSVFPREDATWKDGWQPLGAAGSALKGRACRVWWRPWGGYVLTLAVMVDQKILPEFDTIILQQALLPAVMDALDIV
jgi:4'-phosphopantetheinyl transferase